MRIISCEIVLHSDYSLPKSHRSGHPQSTAKTNSVSIAPYDSHYPDFDHWRGVSCGRDKVALGNNPRQVRWRSTLSVARNRPDIPSVEGGAPGSTGEGTAQSDAPLLQTSKWRRHRPDPWEPPWGARHLPRPLAFVASPVGFHIVIVPRDKMNCF